MRIFVPIPKFKEPFEAWKYGPVIRSVYAANKNDFYTSEPEATAEAIKAVSEVEEIKLFIDDLFEVIDSVSDFKLVERSHGDQEWKRAFLSGQAGGGSAEMDRDAIIKEYAERYLEPN